MKRIVIALLGLALVPAAFTQDFKMPVDLDKLAAKAAETTEVTLNGRTLQLAAKFMNDEDDAEARELVKKLKGIYVRSFEFDKEGEYSQADVESIRSQLRSPIWEKVVNVRSKRDGENAEIYFKTDNTDQIAGLVVIAADPKELTVVHIDGPLDPRDLEKIGGDFGVPRVEARPAPKSSKAGAR
ncbi:MAG TPA: DUF4252 domain-containing protein [Terriglobales bacterium]|nr:DUF4252 domain-containing protein [Terriglobales bacterium]